MTSEIFITLVHGTWARFRIPFATRLPFWFEENSDFSKEILSNLERVGLKAHICKFEWSAKNSIAHRADASKALASQLAIEAAANPDRTQVLIGHSHGGSVCLLAKKHLAAELNPILISLSTPFMEVVSRHRQVPTRLRLDHPLHLTSAMMGPFSLFIYYLLLGEITFLNGMGDVMLFVVLMCMWVSWFGFALLLFRGIIGIRLGHRRRKSFFSPNFRPQRLLPLKAIRLAALTRHGMGSANPGRQLVIRGIDDEAGLALAAGSIGNRLAVLSLKVVYLLCSFIWVYLLAVAIDPVLEFFFGYSFELVRYSEQINILISCVCLAVFTVPLAAGILKSVYGRELLLGALYCEVSAASAPDAANNVVVQTIATEFRSGLRHSIHESPKARKAISDYIIRQANYGGRVPGV